MPRPSVARSTRLVTTGVATAGCLGLVAAMGVASADEVTLEPTTPPPGDSTTTATTAPVSTAATPQPPPTRKVVVVVRRHHPAPTTAAPRTASAPQAPAPKAAAPQASAPAPPPQPAPHHRHLRLLPRRRRPSRVAAEVPAVRTGLQALDARAMGTDLRVVLVAGAPGALERAAARVEGLEAAWSRFRPGSELSRLNRDGRLDHPSDAMRWLVAAMQEAWTVTAGLVDASVLDAVEALGYRRSWPELPAPDPVLDGLAASRLGAAVPGLSGVELTEQAVVLPPGVHLDPGGIGKGLAADLVATALVERGDAAGALVSLGGDLRVVGEAPDATGWTVELDAPAGTRVRVPDGGLASSSVRRRRWQAADGGTAHHVVDPRTGRAARGPRTDTTAVAATAWQAEALATALLLAGPGHPDVEAAADAWCGAGLAVDETGDLTIHDTMEVLLW